MSGEPRSPDVPLPTSLIREPVLPSHREIVMELIKGLDGNEGFGTLKRFLWLRLIDWREVMVFLDGYQIGLIETRDRKNVRSFPCS